MIVLVSNWRAYLENIMRNYRFEIDTPIKGYKSIIIRGEDPITARTDAYNALRSVFGMNARVKTAAADAKVMRRMPNGTEPVRNCYYYENETPVQWAWLVFVK
jgi:hypothetical protein